MSNRFAEAGFMQQIPEPLIAARAGTLFSESRLQSLRTLELGRAFFELPVDIWSGLGRLARSIDGAMQLRDAAALDDRRLADIGIRRDELPALFVNGRLGNLTDGLRGRRKADSAV